MVPLGAVTFAGLKMNEPWKATSMLIWDEVLGGAEGTATGAAEVDVVDVSGGGP